MTKVKELSVLKTFAYSARRRRRWSVRLISPERRRQSGPRLKREHPMAHGPDLTTAHRTCQFARLAFRVCISSAIKPTSACQDRKRARLSVHYLITAGAVLARSRPLGALCSSAGVDGEKRDGLRSGPSVWALPPASFRCLVQPPFFLQVDGRMTRDGNLKVWTAWPLRARTCHPYLIRPNLSDKPERYPIKRPPAERTLLLTLFSLSLARPAFSVRYLRHTQHAHPIDWHTRPFGNSICHEEPKDELLRQSTLSQRHKIPTSPAEPRKRPEKKAIVSPTRTKDHSLASPRHPSRSRNSNGVLPSPVWTIQPSREAQQASPSFGRKSPTNESKLHRHPSPVFVRVWCAADAPSPSWHRCEVPDPSGPLGRDPGTYHTTGATLPWSRPQSTTLARETQAPFFARNIVSKPSKSRDSRTMKPANSDSRNLFYHRGLRGIIGRALVVTHAGNKGDMSCRRTSLAAITLRPTCGASGDISSSIPENLVERIHEAPCGNLPSTNDRLQSLQEK
ncbi:hypothetical protein CMUS01_12238 [Colletotrichum musicola]|uniref:Uncharacterized protein n=1 Tax=Colletotrichum musicola TaxID=2175873 RepID=A0A8H6JNQ9_9PEZI|nr:hypothetical protein CMUS01_12238 [Colletotrichum musicola]